MIYFVDDSTKQEQKGPKLDPDFTFLASIDLSSDDESESQSDENDALNLSCRGNDLKRIREEPKHCDFVMKRRKLSIQLELMHTDLVSMTFNRGSKTISEEPSHSLDSVSCDKCSRDTLNECFNLTSDKADQHSSLNTQTEMKLIDNWTKESEIIKSRMKLKFVCTDGTGCNDEKNA